MSVTLTNTSRNLVTAELKSGDWIHLAPGETSAPIDDVEVHENDRIAKLIERKLIALAKQGAEPDAGASARTEKRETERPPKR
jgi:hypothetical protein